MAVAVLGLPGDARAPQGNNSMQKGMWVRIESIDVGVMEVTLAHALSGRPGPHGYAYIPQAPQETRTGQQEADALAESKNVDATR